MASKGKGIAAPNKQLSQAEQQQLAAMLEEDAAAQPVAPDKLAVIMSQAHELQSIERNIARVTAELEDWTKKKQTLEFNILPALMEEAGMLDTTLDDGSKLERGEEVYASISKENAPLACKWLDDKGYGAIVKSGFTIEIPKGDDGPRQRKYIQQVLVKAKITFQMVMGVHPQTLKAFAKESLAAQRKLPDTIKVHQQPRVTITAPKANSKGKK